MNVVILGGGITGLAAAHALIAEHTTGDAPPTQVTLVEATSRWGGTVHTLRVDGFLVEAGPDAFLLHRPEALALCREVGLGDRVVGVPPQHRRAYVVRRGHLMPLPEGLFLAVPTRLRPLMATPLLSWRGKVRMALDVLIPPRRANGDESVAHFVRRRLGEEALRWLAGPLMAGIHAADPEHLSLLATFPQLADLERRHGSLIRGALASRRQAGARRRGPGSSPFATLAGGLGELIGALVARLEAAPTCRLLLGRPAQAVLRADSGYRVVLANGEILSADAVIAATPAHVTARLVADMAPELACALERIRYTSSAVISLAFRQEELPPLPAGSGFLVPREEGLTMTGCTWSSNKFPGRAPEGFVLWRAFAGGDGRPALPEDDHLVAQVVNELRALLGPLPRPHLALVHRWTRARPLYDVGHLDLVARIEALCPPRFLVAGSAYRGGGLPACIRAGTHAAERALAGRAHPQEEIL
ncbi:MAG: protoporphyrinogen oxidase [Ardenticatenia bacterium]|nr:protoporphyrinogen oxidase [Ardenticatenia bacterium]